MSLNSVVTNLDTASGPHPNSLVALIYVSFWANCRTLSTKLLFIEFPHGHLWNMSSNMWRTDHLRSKIVDFFVNSSAKTSVWGPPLTGGSPLMRPVYRSFDVSLMSLRTNSRVIGDLRRHDPNLTVMTLWGATGGPGSVYHIPFSNFRLILPIILR